jgi:hypothetical protein
MLAGSAQTRKCSLVSKGSFAFCVAETSLNAPPLEHQKRVYIRTHCGVDSDEKRCERDYFLQFFLTRKILYRMGIEILNPGNFTKSIGKFLIKEPVKIPINSKSHFRLMLFSNFS